MFANLSRRYPTFGLCAGHCICAAVGVALFWGFTVDDALVTARVAWRLANGHGYRFNVAGPAVDAVTPLGWVYLIVPFAKRSPMTALAAARWLGAVVWVIAATWLGHALGRAGKRLNLAVLFLAAAPLGAWSSSGMETGAILALGAASLGDSATALVAIGLAAGLRPELVPFCTILGLRHYHARRAQTRWAAGCVLIPLASMALTACIRAMAFGSAVPLAAVAKPSDVIHGLRYVLAALIWTGPAWIWVGGWSKLDEKSRWLAAAIVGHLIGVVLVGGDWMPLWRLIVPAMPAMVWVANSLMATCRKRMHELGAFAGLLVATIMAWQVGLPARQVMRARSALIERASAPLAGAHLVAGLDIGWLGTATPSDILDLAGITDIRVATLPGGHTTKKIPNSWFDFRRPDALVLLSAPGAVLAPNWWETRFARGVENRVAALDYWRHCAVRSSVPLAHTRQFYVIVRCAERD